MLKVIRTKQIGIETPDFLKENKKKLKRRNIKKNRFNRIKLLSIEILIDNWIPRDTLYKIEIYFLKLFKNAL